jgi:hypothetical protein
MSTFRESGTTDRSSGECIMTVSMPKADTATPVPPAAPAVDQDSFVINLCSSTTPMALTQPQLAELKSFKFFVIRRLEDGRERFRLHMGYFDSLLQAEELLPVVREIYPGAWAGEAPGKRLRARAAAANPAPAAISPPPATARAAPPAPVTPLAPVTAARPAVPTPAAGPSAELLANMPTLSAAPEGAATPLAPTIKLELVVDPPRSMPAPVPVTVPAPAPAAPTPAPAVAAAPAPIPVPPKAARAGTPKRNASLPFDQRSNVREVLKSLDEPARQPAASAPQPAIAALPVPPALPILPPGPAVRQAGVLPDSQVLRLLEEKRGDPLNTTSTPAAFSIQLQWSVQPIDLARVPPLAIFGAYTLYTVEGSREGRRWFGLRLGFFSDANSAKQVAQYVRSEFSSVAVVPVSLKERDGARGASGDSVAPGPTGKPTERLPDRTAEFKLLDDTAEKPKLTASAAKPKSTAGAKTAPAAQRGAKGRGNRVNAHEKRAPKTLEETLEILGADQLQIEGSRKKLVSAGAIRHVDMKVQKNSPFSRLLDRLAERNR